MIAMSPTLNLNQQNKSGHTALHLATLYKSINVSVFHYDNLLFWLQSDKTSSSGIKLLNTLSCMTINSNFCIYF